MRHLVAIVLCSFTIVSVCNAQSSWTYPSSGYTNFNGNVGIGSGVTSPANPLQIEGSITELNLLIKNNSTNGARTYLSSFANKSAIQTDKDFAVMTNYNGSWHDVVHVTNQGWMGIGIAAPHNMFDVNGDANIAGKLGIGVTNPTNPLEVQGAIPELNLLVYNTTSSGARTYLTSQVGKSALQTDKDFSIMNNNGGWHDVITVKYNGTVGIGTATHQWIQARSGRSDRRKRS